MERFIKKCVLAGWMPGKVIIILFMLNLAVISQLFGQEAQALDQYLENEGQENTERLRELLYGSEPTIYFAGFEKQYPESDYPQRAWLEVNSLGGLEQNDPKFRTVKLIEVRVNEASELSMVDFTPEKLSGFPNLRYIFIDSKVQVTANEVSQMISGFEEGDITLLFQYAIGN